MISNNIQNRGQNYKFRHCGGRCKTETACIYGALTLQRGGRGTESTEPKRVGATLKNFFLQNSHQTPKSKIYIFLTFIHRNAAD